MTKKEKVRIDGLLNDMVEAWNQDCSVLELTTCPKHIGYIFQKINEIKKSGKLSDGNFKAFYCDTCKFHNKEKGNEEHYIHLQIYFCGKRLEKAFEDVLG